MNPLSLFKPAVASRIKAGKFLLLGLAALGLFARSAAGQSTDNPIAVAVHVTASWTYDSTFTYPGYGSVQSFGLTIVGEPSSSGASDATLTFYAVPGTTQARGVAHLQPDKVYNLDASGTGLLTQTFSVSAPPGYTVEIDGMIQPTINNDYTSYFNPWHTIQIVSPREIAVARSGVCSSLSRDRAYWQVSLGSLQDGKSAGWLSISDLGYGTSLPLFTTAALNYISPNENEVVVYNDGTYYQISTNDAFVDIHPVVSGTSYEIDFYTGSAITGTLPVRSIPSGVHPYVTYLISEVGTTGNALSITSQTYDSAGDAIRTAVTSLTRSGTGWPYTWAVQDWTLSGYTAPVQSTVTAAGSTTSAETTVVENGSSVVAINMTKEYSQYGWGAELTSKLLGSDSATQDQTAYQYYTSSSAPESYGFIETSNHNGHWMGYVYQANTSGNAANDGIIAMMNQQYIDSAPSIPSDLTTDTTSPASALTSYTYTTDIFGRDSYPTVIETKRGSPIISYAGISYTGNSSSDTQELNGMHTVTTTRTDWADNTGATTLTSGTMYYREDVPHEFYCGRLCSSTQANGTKDVYAYQFGSFDGTTFTAGTSGGLTWSSTNNCSRALTIHGTAAGSTEITSVDGYDLDSVYLVPNKSTRDVTIRDQYAHVIYTGTDVWDGSGWHTIQHTAYTYNFANQLTEVSTNEGQAISYKSYVGDQLSTETDPAGVVTAYGYDTAGRVDSITRGASGAGSLLATTSLATAIGYDAANHVTARVIGSTTGAPITSTASYDDAGRVSSTTDPNSGTTSYSYHPSALTTDVTLPNTGTREDITYPDGHLASETGTGVVARYFTYTTGSDGTLTTKVCYGSSGSSRYQTAVTDVLGRTTQTIQPTSNSGMTYTVQNTYNSLGQLWKVSRFDNASAPNHMFDAIYLYDAMGQCNEQGLDISGDGNLTGSTDRITATNQDIEESGGNWWATTKTTTYPYSGSGAATAFTTSVAQQRLTGFGTGVLADQTVTDAYGKVTETTTTTDASNNSVIEATTNPGFSSSATSVTVAGLVVSKTGFDGLPTIIGYDDLWRPITTEDARSNAITTTYVSGTTQAAQTSDALGHTLATYTYDSAGRVASVANNNSKVTMMDYDGLNHVLHQWGDIPYPVQYVYDTYGERTTMYTYQTGTWTGSTWPTGTVSGTTTWTYDAASGLVTRKTDSAGQYVGYSYNNFGQTTQRTWARGTNTYYAYNFGTSRSFGGVSCNFGTGELTGVTYDDGTPSVAYTYTRSGQPASVTDAAGTRTFMYDQSINSNPLEMESESLGSFYGSRYLTRQYDTTSGTGSGLGHVEGRPIGFKLGTSEGSSGELSQVYAYSNLGQFTNVATQSSTSSSRTFAYTYTPYSELVAGYSTGSFSVNRSYESSRDLLTSIQGKWSSAVLTEYDYTHNYIYQASSVVQSGSAFADYDASSGTGTTFRLMTYNDRGELTSDIGYLGSSTSDTSKPLPDRNFAYSFDTAGNRTSSNYSSSSDFQESYTMDTSGLNQYHYRENLSISVSGTIDNNTAAKVAVMNPAGTATVLAGRQGGFWSAEVLPPDGTGGNPVNYTAPANFSATIYAGWHDGGGSSDLVNSSTLSLTIPPQSQAFTYDQDGNLLTDTMWTYTYDGENRLVQMVGATITGVPACTLAFAYDYLGRRIEKDVTTSTGTVRHRFLYDGWNLIADYHYNAGTSTLTLHRTFTWGLDVTGGLTAAGGVGALLEETNFNYDTNGTLNGTSDYFATYDGNGNVASLVSAGYSGSGALAAVYEYSPFGEPLRSQNNDSAVADNPFKFSTKFTDKETGLIYYGNRFYSTTLGRFINRDPMEEAGGINLYGFVSNNPANSFDVLGFAGNALPGSPEFNADQYWQDQGNGTIGGGNQEGPSTIEGVWGLQGQEGTDWDTKLVQDWVNYNRALPGPDGNSTQQNGSPSNNLGIPQSSGDGMRDIGVAVANFFKEIVSGGGDSSNSVGNVGRVILGQPIVIDWEYGPDGLPQAQSANSSQNGESVTYNITTAIVGGFEAGQKSSQTVTIDPGSGKIISQSYSVGTTNILGIKFPGRTSFFANGFSASSTLNSDGSIVITMSGQTGSVTVPADITYNYTLTYSPLKGTTTGTGSNEEFPTYTITQNGVIIYKYNQKSEWLFPYYLYKTVPATIPNAPGA